MFLLTNSDTFEYFYSLRSSSNPVEVLRLDQSWKKLSLKREKNDYCFLFLTSHLYWNVVTFEKPLPLFPSPPLESRQCIHQTVTTTHLTFVWSMCKRVGVAQCSHSVSVIMDIPPDSSQPGENFSSHPYLSKYMKQLCWLWFLLNS